MNQNNDPIKDNLEDRQKGWDYIIETVTELLKVIVISLVIIIPVRYFLLQPFFVKGASMEPNFFDHEYLVIDEISYRFKEPHRGDIVVFRYPKDPRQFFIKRIVALPNETIEIKNNTVYINGVKIDESQYLPTDNATVGNVFTKLGPTEFFVMGDNRNYSLDSRSFGPVTKEFIVGRAWFRGFPFNKFKIFSSPDYKFN